MQATFKTAVHRPACTRPKRLSLAVDVEPGATGVVLCKFGPDPFRPDGEPIYLVRLDSSGQDVAVRAGQLELIP